MPEMARAVRPPPYGGSWDVALMLNPDLLVPPTPLVPYLAWRQRLTELAGPDKVGKSTLLRQAAIAVATGSRFLGQQLNEDSPGRVCWFGLEESLADMWRPMVEMGYRPTDERIFLVHQIQGLDGFQRALEAAQDWALIVVDTLAAFGYALDIESERDETEMTRVLHVLLETARGGPAIVLNHHHTKSESPRERGSGAIAATCDVVLNMTARPGEEGVVDVRARGRIPVQSFALRSVDRQFVLAEAPMATVPTVIRQADALLNYVLNNPGCSNAQKIGKALKIGKSVVLVLLHEHARAGRIQDISNRAGRPIWVVPDRTVPNGAVVPELFGTAGMVNGSSGSQRFSPKGERTVVEPEPLNRDDRPSQGELHDLDRGEAWEQDDD